MQLTNIRSIWDNGGKTVDRYTVILDWESMDAGCFMCFSMSANPEHPQGFGQHGEAKEGAHLGKRITFEELPEAARKCLKKKGYLVMETELIKGYDAYTLKYRIPDEVICIIPKSPKADTDDELQAKADWIQMIIEMYILED